ncbi:MAG: flagellar hook-associated protein FlgL [Syntrophaceae bacterium]
MRVTNRDLYYQLVRDIGNVSEKMLDLNKQLSSAKRINKPSEDPVGMASVLVTRTELNAFDQFSKSIVNGRGWLNSTDSILQELDNLLARASELATSQSSDTATADTRTGTAEEVHELYEQILGLANSKYGNKYMFGGTITQTAPFEDVSGVVQYNGNDDTFSIKIGKTDTVQISLPGSEVFTNPSGNIFTTLSNLEQALRNNDQTAIRASLTDIEDASQVIYNNLASVGARENRLDYTETRLGTAKTDTTERLSETEDLDYAEAILYLQNQQVIYQATLKSASMITSMSLMNYIS